MGFTDRDRDPTLPQLAPATAAQPVAGSDWTRRLSAPKRGRHRRARPGAVAAAARQWWRPTASLDTMGGIAATPARARRTRTALSDSFGRAPAPMPPAAGRAGTGVQAAVDLPPAAIPLSRRVRAAVSAAGSSQAGATFTQRARRGCNRCIDPIPALGDHQASLHHWAHRRPYQPGA